MYALVTLQIREHDDLHAIGVSSQRLVAPSRDEEPLQTGGRSLTKKTLVKSRAAERMTANRKSHASPDCMQRRGANKKATAADRQRSEPRAVKTAKVQTRLSRASFCVP